MVQYKCERCTKIFKNKYDYTRHLNRKFKCKIVYTDDSENSDNKNDTDTKQDKVINQKKHLCQYCNNYYSSASYLNKHIKNSCKIKKQIKDCKIDMIKNEIINNEVNDDNSVNVFNNNVNFLMLEEEQLDLLTDDDLYKLTNNRYDSIPELFDNINKDRLVVNYTFISNLECIIAYNGTHWSYIDSKIIGTTDYDITGESINEFNNNITMIIYLDRDLPKRAFINDL